MKKLTGILCAAACLMLTGCALDYTYTEADLRNDYLVSWIKTYGLIDPEQDWNMAEQVEMPVNPNDFYDNGLVCIYTDDPLAGGQLIGRTSTAQVLHIDVLKGTESLYVRGYNAQRTRYIDAIATVKDGRAELTGLSRADKPATDEASSYSIDVTSSRANGDGEVKTEYNWILACEDLGATSSSDIDFNDIVLGINHLAGETVLTITPLAAGGTLEAYVMYGDKVLGEIHEQFGVDTRTMYNTTEWNGPGTPWIETCPSDFTVTDKMGDIRLKIKRPDGDKLAGNIITAPEHMGEAPSIICITGDWQWPTEGTNIHTSYPGFQDWSANKTQNDWYMGTTPADDKIVKRGTPAKSPVTKREIVVDGVTREYYLHVPTPVSANTPLIVALHGASNQATDFMPFKYDSSDPFIIAYPQGLKQNFGPFGTVPGWDAVRSDKLNRGETVQSNEDTKFLRALVNDVASMYTVDRNKVYCCGFSNGGMMAYAAAATMSDVFAACAAIEGFPVNEFHLLTSGPRPVPFLHIHGQKDDFVDHRLFPNIRDNMVTRNGCNPVPVKQRFDESGKHYTKRTYSAEQGGADYVTIEVDDLGHWYAHSNLNNWNTKEVMWGFLQNYTLSTATNNLVWRLNPDKTGFTDRNSYNYWATEINWDWWDLQIDQKDGKERIVFGNPPVEQNTTNVYPSVQLAPGWYYIEYKATGTSGHKVHIDLVNEIGTNNFSKVHGTSEINGNITKVWFYIYTLGDYQLTLAKDDANDKFNDVTIYRDSSEKTAENFTPDGWSW